MFELFARPDFLTALRWQDWLDILIVAVIIYESLRLIRGTRSMQVLLGVAVLLGAYWFSRKFDISTLSWLLGNFLSYIIIVLVILFQADIRRALSQVARFSFSRTSPEVMSAVGEVVKAAFTMAEKRIGALIVFEREIGLKNYLEGGILLDAKVTRDLLLSIFNTSGPLHDGAVVIQRARLAAAACFLPLSTEPDISSLFGTRHRAAIGLSRETDAAVVVVSEERGLVSLVLDGQVSVMFDQDELQKKLAPLLRLTVVTPSEETDKINEAEASL